MQSLYATRFGYQLSNPVTLTFMLGVQNSRYSGYNYLPGNVNSFFGGVALDYTPTDNMWFHLELQHNPFSTLRAYESSLPVTKPK
jgi:hypothetical protein